MVAMLIALATFAVGTPTAAQQSKPCKQILCAPTFTLQAGLNRSHVFGSPRVQSLVTGAVEDLPPQNNLEIILLFGIPTFVPHSESIRQHTMASHGHRGDEPLH